METAHSILWGYWLNFGEVPKRAKGAEALVAEIEMRYELTMPPDFREYLIEAAPEEDFWDQGEGVWWSLHRIKSIPEEYQSPVNNLCVAQNSKSYLFFADYCFWFWAWAICCDESEDRGKIVAIDGRNDLIVASSFTDFVKAFVIEPLSVSPS